jgi:hypothetical protein
MKPEVYRAGGAVAGNPIPIPEPPRNLLLAAGMGGFLTLGLVRRCALARRVSKEVGPAP